MAKDKKKDLPYMPFYVGDWLKCPEVRALPPDYRGLWFDLLCYMWESTERGVMVTPNGRPYTDNEIVRMIGLDNQNSGNWLTSLIAEGVCYRRPDGAIYSKRMVKDEEIRQIRRETGAKGGNPILLDKGIDKDDVNLNPENENINKEELLKKRESEFVTQVSQYSTKYPLEMLKAFCRYWTEPNKSRTKMKWELEKTFEIGRRLVTWAGNDKTFNRQQQAPQTVNAPIKSSQNFR